MINKVKILKPGKDGLKVFNPATGLHLSAKGEEIHLSNYWLRMIRCGDAVEVVETKPEQKSADIYDLPKDHEQVAGYDPGHQYPHVVDEQAGEKFNDKKKKQQKIIRRIQNDNSI